MSIRIGVMNHANYNKQYGGWLGRRTKRDPRNISGFTDNALEAALENGRKKDRKKIQDEIQHRLDTRGMAPILEVVENALNDLKEIDLSACSANV